MINEFEYIAKNYGVPSEILEKIENDISGDGGRPVSLTALQKETIKNDKFWCANDSNVNVIIQGATSSGKTLVAELLALQCVFSMNKHVVYLVPLKALVSEKVQQFKKDIHDAERKMRINIFASSSDYQDHDTELAEGQYDIAVVVYEKFFAMLAEQKDNKFLEKCGLIVVDEIQLLGSQDRGAKLEYSLTKVKNNFQNSIRILGLTTVDCDTNYVNNWLKAEIIKNSQRPIGLKERIISLSGLFWERQISGEDNPQKMETDVEPFVERIEIEGGEKLKNQKIDVKRNALLCALLKRISDEDSEKKIIVFASSRERCKIIAGYIAKGNVYGKQAVDADLINELEKTDDESEKNLLQNELLPYGIAYHSAALPMSLRELIEFEFKKSDGSIKLIVATETITIGMNLPADVMILYDNKVFRGSDGAVDIRPQEYKNYIGRAGRLGITDKIGESYLFVDTDSDIQYYWKQYVNCKIEEVSSALINASPRESAPYYLNLLCKGKEEVFSERTIEELADKTLNAAEATIKGRKYSVETSKIIKDFKKVELIRDKDIESNELDDDIDSAYKLTNFGEMLAPYALSIETCFKIKKYFRDGENKTGKSGGLPITYAGKDLKKNKYLLDILFVVCKMDEVKRISHPRLPEPKNPHNRMVYQIIEKAILNYLAEYKKKEGADAFWDNSEISKVFFNDDDIETDQLNAALRAILLFHWIKGELPSQMKDSTGLKNKEFILYTGDMSRIGESCSYVVEAISKCLFTNAKRTDDGGLEHAFYSLAVKLKYGLSNPNLIQVANRHVYGLSRSTIIRMDRAAQKYGFDNINLFIRSSNKKVLEYLTSTQRRDLIQQMSERYDDRNIENLITKLVEDEIVDFSLESDFKVIAHPRQMDEWLDSIKNVFATLDGVKHYPLPQNLSLKGIRLQWEEYKLYMLLMLDKSSISNEKSIECREKMKLLPDDKVLYLYNRDTELKSENPNDILISADYISKVILEFLALSGCTDGINICNYLYEQEGVVSNKGMSSLQKSIEKILEHSNIKADQEKGDEDTTSYEQYIRKYEYTDDGIWETECGHATIHRVEGKHRVGEYVIKEIRIPENVEEFKYLDSNSRELYQKHGEVTDDEEIKNIIRELCHSVISSEDLDEIIKVSHEREKQLYSSIKDRKLYFYQSIVFLTEGYKRLHEARIAASLDGSHIVNIHNPEIFHRNYEHPELRDVDTKFNKLKSELFFAMKLYVGSLWDRRTDLKGQRDEIIKIGIQINEALIACHEKKILHRDIKPANILFTKNNEYFLGDFGSAVEINNGKTRSVGTKGYMAPEAALGDYSRRSDIYSLGKTLLILYTGNNKQQNIEDDKLLQVLNKACEEDPHKRFESAQQFTEALRNLSDYGAD